MNFQTADLAFGVAIGLGSTLLMDCWNSVLKRGLGVPSLNYCLLGRWVLHLPRGVFRHANISAAPPMPRECAVGWVSHYAIGTCLALTFVMLAPSGWLQRPTWFPAVAFGLATVVFPFFVLQPALGLGPASSRAPDPVKARLKSLMTHLVFGIGLFLCALVASPLLRQAG